MPAFEIELAIILKTVLKSSAERLQTNAPLIPNRGSHFRKLTPDVERLDHSSGNFITSLNRIGHLRRRVSGKEHSGRTDTLSQIKVQAEGGKWRTEWAYGEDPFPRVAKHP